MPLPGCGEARLRRLLGVTHMGLVLTRRRASPDRPRAQCLVRPFTVPAPAHIERKNVVGAPASSVHQLRAPLFEWNLEGSAAPFTFVPCRFGGSRMTPPRNARFGATLRHRDCTDDPGGGRTAGLKCNPAHEQRFASSGCCSIRMRCRRFLHMLPAEMPNTSPQKGFRY